MGKRDVFRVTLTGNPLQNRKEVYHGQQAAYAQQLEIAAWCVCLRSHNGRTMRIDWETVGKPNSLRDTAKWNI
jgi:hypothetical protein